MARSQQQTSLVNDNNDVKNPATGNHFKNDNGNDDGGLLADNKAPPSPSPSSHFQQHPPEKRQELGDATAAANSTDSHIFSGSGGGGGAASTDTATATPLSNGLLAIGETKKPGTSEIREREQSATPDASAAAATTTSAAAAAAATANGCTAPVRQPSFHPAQPEDEEEERERGDSGGGAEAHAVVGCSGGGGRGRVAARGGGELTVAIPPAAAGAAAGIAGHLRSHSMTMLDEIAESLADTSRKPSFARMQSVQVRGEEGRDGAGWVSSIYNTWSLYCLFLAVKKNGGKVGILFRGLWVEIRVLNYYRDYYMEAWCYDKTRSHEVGLFCFSFMYSREAKF